LFFVCTFSEVSTLIVIYIEQTAERTRKEATGPGQHAGSLEDPEEQRKVSLI